MSVFFRVHISAAAAAVSRKAYLGFHNVYVRDEHIEDLDIDEIRAVFEESSPSIEQANRSCDTFDLQFVPQSFPDDPTLVVKMLACARTKATMARVVLAHQELQDIELGRVPDARVLGTVVGEFFVPRPALGLDATKDTFELELDRIRSKIPGIESGGVIAMKPKSEPFAAVPLHSVAEKACSTPELQCAAILNRLYWIVAAVSEIDDPEDIIMLVSTKEPSLFDADFPVMDGSFSPRKSPSQSALSTLACICQRTGMRPYGEYRDRSDASSEYQYKMISSVVRYTPEGGGSPITGVLVECRVRRIADGEECIRGLFVPTEA
jgi:hypothetical protein